MKGQVDYLRTLYVFYEQLQINWRVDLKLTYNKDIEPIIFMNNTKRIDHVYNIPFSKRIYITKGLINRNIAFLRKILYSTNLYDDHKNLLMLDIRSNKIILITYDMYGRRKKSCMKLSFNWFEYKLSLLFRLI